LPLCAANAKHYASVFLTLCVVLYCPYSTIFNYTLPYSVPAESAVLGNSDPECQADPDLGIMVRGLSEVSFGAR